MILKKEKFRGDEKDGKCIFHPLEKRLKKYLLSKVPKKIETYHLTLMTIFWSIMIIFFGFLASKNIFFLAFSSLMIFFQYITDLLDGSIGRHRKTGLILWGYYMDHFLDYIFLCSILIGYFFVIPEKFYIDLFFILAVFGGFMVNSYLAFAATNSFKIEYLGIGPTEIRFVFIIINTLFMIFEKTYLAQTLPFVLIFSIFGLIFVVYETQKKIWKKDMENKK